MLTRNSKLFDAMADESYMLCRIRRTSDIDNAY